MKNKGSGITLIILVAAIIAVISVAFVSIIRHNARQNEKIVQSLASTRDDMVASVKQDAYAYIQSYVGRIDGNGNVVYNGQTSGAEMTVTEINALVEDVAEIVENVMTDEVMTGASELAVNALQKDIDDLVKKRVTKLSDRDKVIMSRAVQRTVLETVRDGITSAQSLAESNASNIALIQNDNTKTKNAVDNNAKAILELNTAIKSIDNDIDKESRVRETSDKQISSQIESVQRKADANTQTISESAKELEERIAEVEKNAKAVPDMQAKYDYDTETQTFIISLPENYVNIVP